MRYNNLPKTIVLAALLATCFCFYGFGGQAPYKDAECLKCHGMENLSQPAKDGTLRSISIKQDAEDVHLEKGMECVDCHTDANPNYHPASGLTPVDCSKCHAEATEEHQDSAHHEYSMTGANIPTCQDCHSDHEVLRGDNPESSVSRENIGDTCGKCHPDKNPGAIKRFLTSFQISHHNKADIASSYEHDQCTSCHATELPRKNLHSKDYVDCSSCHMEQEDAGLFANRFHKQATCSQPVTLASVLANGIGALTIVCIVLIVILALVGLRVYKEYKEKAEEA